jgi:hypothetical protein
MKSEKSTSKARGARSATRGRTKLVAKPPVEESTAPHRANPLLESREIVDLRDVQTEIRNSLGKEAATNEQRALQAIGRLFSAKRTHGRPIQVATPHLVEGGRTVTHPPFHVSCAAIQAVSHPKEADLVPWTNWGIIDAQSLQLGSCSIRKMFSPTNSYEISSAIRQAEADGRTLRALGSGWSFSDAALPQETDVDPAQLFELATGSPPISKFFGYAVQPDGFTSSLQYLLPRILRADVNMSSVFFVEAGIKLHDLNELLNSHVPPVALKTLGGSDGQCLGGAISTGVHGSDYDRPPLADSVGAIYLIGAGGVHHWIEPASRQITDLAKIVATFPCIAAANCHYDDGMFNAALVSMGSMGVIYAVVLDVVEQYALIQFNIRSTWEKILADSAGDLFQGLASGAPIDNFLDQFFQSHTWPLFPAARSLQILINPIHNDDGTHNCYASIRFEVPLRLMPPDLAVPSGVQPGGFPSITNDDISSAIQSSPEWGVGPAIAFAGAQVTGSTQFQTAQNLISFCKSYSYFWAIRAIIDLVYQKSCPLTQDPIPPLPQIDIGYKVMAGGTALGTNFTPFQISSFESAFSLQQAISYVNSLLASFDAGVDLKTYPTGYLSLRTCGRTGALMGMQQFGRQGGSTALSEATGTVEMSMLGNSDGFDLIRQAERLALSMNGILHWGQSNGLMNANDVKQRFPNLPAWQAVQQKLGGTTFTNLFMKRCGLV